MFKAHLAKDYFYMQISVPCQDDQFGFNGAVVFDDMSVPLRRCTPFVNQSADYR